MNFDDSFSAKQYEVKLIDKNETVYFRKVNCCSDFAAQIIMSTIYSDSKIIDINCIWPLKFKIIF